MYGAYFAFAKRHFGARGLGPFFAGLLSRFGGRKTQSALGPVGTVPVLQGILQRAVAVVLGLPGKLQLTGAAQAVF